MSEEEEEKDEEEEENIPPEQGKSILPAAYALFAFFFSFLLLSFVCGRNKKSDKLRKG